MTSLFILKPEHAEEFFKRCMKEEAVTEEERMGILKKLYEEGKADVVQTPLGKASVKRRLKENFDILDIQKKEKGQ